MHQVRYLNKSSASMETDNRWTGLINAFNSFYQNVLMDAKFKSKIKVTIIEYSSKAMMRVDTQTPMLEHVSKLQFLKGGTFFGAPLEMAYENVSKNFDQIANYMLYFMTDGDDAYPDQEVKRFLNDSEMMLRCKFNFVKYGNDLPQSKENSLTLQKMSNELKGSLTNALSYNEILNSMIEIVKSL